MNIEEVFTKLRPIMGSQLDTLWLEYLVADPSLRQTIERTLRVTLAQRLAETFEKEQVLLKPPPRDLAEGEYPVGMIHYGKDKFYQFGLREDEFIQHIGIFGRSGSGKTNLAYLLLHGLVKAQKPFLVFDWKRNYRDLISAPEFADLIIFTVGRDVASFRFNPLIPPPGTPATVWLKKLIEIMCHAYFLGEGVTVLLMRAIDHLYQQGGMYDDKSKGCPTMADVRDYLLAYKAKGREAGWMESAMRAVEVLCFGEMGNVLSSAQPFDIAKLLDRNVILELDALTNADKTFLIESLLLWIHHYRMGQSQREDFKHSIIIEEAHHILLRKKQEVTGEEAVTDIILREIRELGESVICLDQHPSLISKPALGNTYTSFVFNLKHRSDIAMVQDCLHLDSEQTRYLGRLEVGWAVAKLQGRWFFPFLIKLPLVHLRKGSVTDQDIQLRASKLFNDSRMLIKSLKGFSAVISAQEGNSSPEETPDRKIPLIPSGGKKEKKDMEDGCAIRLTTQERKFLMDIWQHPNSAVTERYQRLDVSHRVGNNIQNSLFRLGLISSSFIVLSKWRIKILLLKEKGRKILGISASQSDRHGGTEHRYWIRTIADHLKKQGYEVAEEFPVGGGKAIDIVASRDGKKIAFEIETGNSDVVANARKCLGVGRDRIVIVATSNKVYSKIRHELRFFPKIQIFRSHNVLKQKWV
ncbi:helicase HerA domain-containing protein [Planctomycetota bacterium]